MTEVHIARLVTALLAKGFIRDESKHHTQYWLVVREKRPGIHTWISHGQRRADDWLFGQIAKQLHLTKRELLRFIECEIGYDEYVELMIGRAHLRL
jgi:hypothetical protein